MKKIFILLPLFLLAASCNNPTAGNIQTPTALSPTTSPVSNLAMKQKCSQDGQAYFENTVKPQYSATAIAKANQELSPQAMNAWIKSEDVVNEEYAYNAKFNTCLIAYKAWVYFNSGSVEWSGYIKDIYTNREITSFNYFDGKNAGAAYQTSDQFATDEEDLMGVYQLPPLK